MTKKTFTLKADGEFDALLTSVARRLNTTKSRVIRDAMRNDQTHPDNKARRNLSGPLQSLKATKPGKIQSCVVMQSDLMNEPVHHDT